MSLRLRNLIKSRFQKRDKQFVTLGDYNSNVVVPGHTHMHHARMNGIPVKVWNRTTDPINNLEVEVEYKNGMLQVVGVRSRAIPLIDGIVGDTNRHGETHTEGAVDPIYIYLSQILNARIIPDGLKIRIHRHTHLGALYSSPQQSAVIDLTSHLPTSGARWVLVYLDYTGAYQLIDGNVADTKALLTIAAVPELPFGGWAIAAVRLYTGQTAISHRLDVFDLRWPATPYNAAINNSSETIASGAITVRSSLVIISGEGSANDDLETISGGVNGSLISLRPGGQVITIKHDVGNILLAGGVDVSLSDISQIITLIYDSAQSKWLQYSASGTGGGSSSGGIVRYPASGAAVVYEANSAGLASALADLTSGDLVSLPRGTYTGDYTADCAATIIGASPYSTMIVGTVTCNAGTGGVVTLENLNVTNTESGTTVSVAVEVASGSARIVNCEIYAIQTGTANSFTIHLADATSCTIGWTYFRATAANSGVIARIISTSGTPSKPATFFECIFTSSPTITDAADANWEISNGMTAYLYACSWHNGYTPATVDYLEGDRSPIDHVHTGSGATVVTKTSPYSPDGTRDEFILADGSISGVTITLPAVSGLENRTYWVFRTDPNSTGTNDMLIETQVGETLYSHTANLQRQYSCIKLVCDGIAWYGYTVDELHSHDLSAFYTKSDLQTSGLSNVHWDNITNEPATFPPSSHTHVMQAILTVEGTLSIVDNPLRIYNVTGAAKTISKVFLSVNTAPAGAAIIVDIHKGGTTIFTTQANRPQIAAGANTGYTTTIDVATWADGEYLTMHVDQVGSTTAGSNLIVHIVYS